MRVFTRYSSKVQEFVRRKMYDIVSIILYARSNADIFWVHLVIENLKLNNFRNLESREEMIFSEFCLSHHFSP